MTADSGPENIIIIWDYHDLFPQKTLFSPHGASNIAKVAISSDAKYLLTMAYLVDKISLHWWIWSLPQNTPHGESDLLSLPMHWTPISFLLFSWIRTALFHSNIHCFKKIFKFKKETIFAFIMIIISILIKICGNVLPQESKEFKKIIFWRTKKLC